MKETILSYLQENALSLYRKYGLLDARFEDNPPRIVLESDRNMEAPKLAHNGKDLPVEVVVVDIREKPIKPLASTANQPLENWKKRHGKATNIDTVLNSEQNPDTSSKKDAQNPSAYEAWVRRHSAVKRGT
jgi:hypothetical protein